MFRIIFCLLMLAYLLSLIPLWVFLVPLAGLALGCVHFWKRTRRRNVCIVLAVPLTFAAIPAMLTINSKTQALRAHFGTTISSDNIVKYRHDLVGMEDHRHYWKLRDINANDCDRLIQEYGLTPAHRDDGFGSMTIKFIDANDQEQIIQKDVLIPLGHHEPFDHLHSRTSPPSWWPKSTNDYTIYEGDDEHKGTREIWVPQEGATTYLFKFSE